MSPDTAQYVASTTKATPLTWVGILAVTLGLTAVRHCGDGALELESFSGPTIASSTATDFSTVQRQLRHQQGRVGVRSMGRAKPGDHQSRGVSPTSSRMPHSAGVAKVESAIRTLIGYWKVDYVIGGTRLIDYWHYVRGRWLFDLLRSNPAAVLVYRLPAHEYVVAVGCSREISVVEQRRLQVSDVETPFPRLSAVRRRFV